MPKISVSGAKRQHERAMRNKKYSAQKKLTTGKGKAAPASKANIARRAKTPAVAKPIPTLKSSKPTKARVRTDAQKKKVAAHKAAAKVSAARVKHAKDKMAKAKYTPTKLTSADRVKHKANLAKHNANQDAKAKKAKAAKAAKVKSKASRTAQLKKHFKGMFSGKSGKMQGKK